MIDNIDFKQLGRELTTTKIRGERALMIARAIVKSAGWGERLCAASIARRLGVSSALVVLALEILDYQGFARHAPRKAYFRANKRGEVVDPQRYEAFE